MRVYVDKNAKDVFSQLSCPVFTDTVYQNIKDMYEALFDDDDTNDVDFSQVDDSAFGFDLDSNKSIIGHFYIFLMTIYNLIDVKSDRTPIIDSKGQIQGHVRYSLDFKVFEPYGNADQEIKDLMDYESLSELAGKKLRLNFQIHEGEGLPGKLCTKTFCEYEFYHSKDPNDMKHKEEDQESSDDHFGEEVDNKHKKKLFRTRVHEPKSQSPPWGYACSHLMDIDDDVITKL